MTNDSLETEVLIVGAGPAGLMAATWLAQTGVNTVLIDQKSCRTQVGHADGIESRTMEIMDCFGLGDSLWKRANLTIELCLWNECANGGIEREIFLKNGDPTLSRYHEATLGQGQIEQAMLDFVQSKDSVNVLWNSNPVNLDIFQDKRSYPVQVKLRDGSCADRTINAKYLVGCDGAHSWVREQLALRVEGDRTDEHWGVIDVIPVTDFREYIRSVHSCDVRELTDFEADIRKRCIIKSTAGHLMVIPREGRLVRCYIQLSAKAAEDFRGSFHPTILLNIVSDILSPYSFTAAHVEWSTIYSVSPFRNAQIFWDVIADFSLPQIGQRICPELLVQDRIFLAGDAIHTHSPKAGKGMNVSIQDTFNLGWKLTAVVHGRADASILRTYQDERLAVAKSLVSFDKKMVHGLCSKHMSPGNSDKNTDRKASASFRATLKEENTTASGADTQYNSSSLVVPACRSNDCKGEPAFLCYHSELATGIAIGTRLASHQVLCQSDARPWDIHEMLRCTGEWHMLIFGGDIAFERQHERVSDLASDLMEPSSVINRINRQGGSPVGKVSVYLIHCARRRGVELMDLGEIFRPFDPELGYDYWRVFADNDALNDHCGSAHQFYGIGGEGCIVLLRPDQHVAFIGALDELHAAEKFLQVFTLMDVDN
ncbi:unnamed protein product [Penicillium olsonii]|nr:unnamed protein product [Penicillium olsonii]